MKLPEIDNSYSVYERNEIKYLIKHGLVSVVVNTTIVFGLMVIYIISISFFI